MSQHWIRRCNSRWIIFLSHRQFLGPKFKARTPILIIAMSYSKGHFQQKRNFHFVCIFNSKWFQWIVECFNRHSKSEYPHYCPMKWMYYYIVFTVPILSYHTDRIYRKISLCKECVSALNFEVGIILRLCGISYSCLQFLSRECWDFYASTN